MLRFILVLICLSALKISAQVELENRSISQPDLQILYAGRENIIAIISSDSSAEYSITTGGSIVKQINSNTFDVKPSYQTAADTIYVYKAGKLILKKTYRVLNMPINLIQIGNLTPIQKKASKKELLENPTIRLVENSLYISSEKILSFDFKLYSPTAPDSLIFEKMDSKGTDFSPDQINAIKNAQAGDRLEISRIIVMDAKGIKYVYRGIYVIIN